MQKKSGFMKDPLCYRVIKQKDDGVHWENTNSEGKTNKLGFAILFQDTIYMLPKEVGDKLVLEGYAKEANPKPLELKELKNVSN